MPGSVRTALKWTKTPEKCMSPLPQLWNRYTIQLLAEIWNCAFTGEHMCVMEKAMAPHSSTLAWKIPWMEDHGRLQSMGSLRVGHDWATSLWLFTFMHWRRKWQPTPVVLPGESHGQRSQAGYNPWGRRAGHDWIDLAHTHPLPTSVQVVLFATLQSFLACPFV